MTKITESEIEKFTIELLEKSVYQYIYAPSIAPDSETPERESFEDVLLLERLQAAVGRINPSIPADIREDAIKQIRRLNSPELIANNEAFHRMLTEGIKVSYQKKGHSRGDLVWLVDFKNSENNDFLVANQFTVIENNVNKRPDVVLFVNGLPLVVIELKNPVDENATVKSAFKQLQTHKQAIPGLFTYNGIMIISDGLEAKAGSISAGFTRFMAWKTADGKVEASPLIGQLETLIKGILDKKILLDLIRHFIVFEKNKKEDKETGIISVQTVKKLVSYHQYYAVNRAVESTLRASGYSERKREMPGGFEVRESPASYGLSGVDSQPMGDRKGGVVFTTIQKFQPEEGNVYETLSPRKNIIVIADEAHRTQYGFKAKTTDDKDKDGNVVGKKVVYGFAKYLRDALPNATYLGFTGTPIESIDVNTPAVFGNYVDVYDVAQAVEDGATVTIYYESRLAKINLSEEGKKLVAELDDELDQGDLTEIQKAKAKWTQLEALIGSEDRIRQVAQDIINHFEQRQEVFEGKAMIVTMSRRIAADLYKEIINIKPQWHSDNLKKGVIKVVMTSASSDGPEISRHHTTKNQRRALADRMKDPEDELKLVIVRDMWLTGFDVPCMHTLYIDKPMKGHNLMQAIARVNRVYKDKPGGLIVDYLGIASDLKKALSFYSDSGGKGDPAIAQEKAVQMMLEKLEVVSQMFHRFAYEEYFEADTGKKLSLILAAEEHILGLENGKKRYINEVTALSRAFSIAISHEQAMDVKDEVSFFQAVKSRLAKFDSTGAGKTDEEMETAIRQVIDKALVTEQVIDVFDAAGIKKPDISILSEEFLLEVKNMEHKNIALEVLKKLLNDEIRARIKKNLIQGKSLLEMLENFIKRYHNKIITAAEVIEELIALGKDIQEMDKEPQEMGLLDNQGKRKG